MARKPAVLYGPSDIAAHYDVTLSAVSNWIRRGSGPIPSPEYVTRSGLVYWSERTIRALPAYDEPRGRGQYARRNRFKELTGRDS